MSAAGLPVCETWAHQAGFEKDFNAALAARLVDLSATERPEAVICHSAIHAQELIEAFALRGFTLYGAGGAGHEATGPALPIRVDTRAMGSVAAQLLHWRLLQPNRAVMRTGVAMRFEEPAV
jgi:DNA-binding LacI/PurR family transcriptional regulator